MKIITFRGLRIRIENEAGSTRSGADHDGKKWSIKMPYAYGEIIGTDGVDGDEVDVFVGPDTSAKFVQVIHQLNKQTGEFDEDKCFVGFQNAQDAKAAYYKAYTNADLFYGSIETIPIDVFKKMMKHSDGDNMIHASVTVGDPVIVDGLRGRGVVVADDGSDVVIRYRNGEHFKRKKYNVHNMGDNTYKSRYSTIQAYGTSSGVTKAWDTRGRGRHSRHITEAINYYQNDQGYELVNHHLRGTALLSNRDRGTAQTVIGALDEGFKNEPLVTSKDKMVYRGINSDALYDKYSRGNWKGKVISDKAFVSTSSKKSNANEFATQGQEEKGIRFEIKLPKGSSFLAPDNSEFEGEMLLNRGAKFKIYDVTKTQARSEFGEVTPVLSIKATYIPKGIKASREEEVEMEGNPIRVPHGTNKRIEKIGTNFCVISDGVDRNFGCYPSREQAEAVLNGKSFIQPDLPAAMYAATPKKGFVGKLRDKITMKVNQKTGELDPPKMKAGGPGSGRHTYTNPQKDEEGNYPLPINEPTEQWQREGKHSWQNPAKVNAGGPGSGRKKDDSEGEGEFPVAQYNEKFHAPWEDIKSATGMPQTGWQYGKRTMPVGYVPQRTLSGFPVGTGGGRGSLPKVPHHGTPAPKPHPTPHFHPHSTIAKPHGMAHISGPKTLPKPGPIIKVKPYHAPAGTGTHLPNPAMKNRKTGVGHKFTLESFGDLGEPMAGALSHAHIEPESWFHPPSLEKRKKADHVPTDDPGEKDDRFLDVTKRNSKDTREERMKILKRGAPGGLPPYIPAHTTLVGPHQAMFSSRLKQRKPPSGGLLDVIPRRTSLKVPHQVAYTKGVRANREKRMFVSYDKQGCM